MKKPLKKSVKNKKNIYKIKKKNLEAIISKRFNILIILVIILNITLLISLYSVQIVNHTYYLEKENGLNKQIVSGETAPRGRIYDRNHRLIVDNIPIKTITYKKLSGVSQSEEISLAYKLASILELNIDNIDDNILK